jgi:hypothetical protein
MGDASNPVVVIQGIWHVPLSPDHPGYQLVGLRPRLDDLSEYPVVIVDLLKVLHYWEADDRSYFLDPVPTWPEEQRKGISRFLSPPSPSERFVEMPMAYLHDVTPVTLVRRWLFFRQKIAKQRQYLGFTNGRHRTRYLEFAGATHMPMQTGKKSESLLRRYCT